MNYARIFICCALLLLMAAGCKSNFNTAPILDIQDQTVDKGLSLSEVEKCIKSAGVRLGWKMTTVSTGLIEATLFNRQHTAVVSIPFSKTKYSILYKDSKDLYSDNGTIHKSYNRWIKNLEKEIGIEFSRSSIR
jgi:hypothetical protein